MRIAFAGNPNSGKTTMYNALTGRNEKIGNWGAIGLQLGTGYTIAFLVNQFGTLFTEGHFAAGFVPGLIAEAVMVTALILIARKVRAHFDEQYELHKASKAAKATA